MQSVPREWLVFLREQYPKDSRIRLTEMGADPRPLPPGSTGKLDFIDDAGQFHVKWDNGRTLALVLGKDRFSIYPPEPQTLKLYMPITADFYGRDEWGDMSEYGEEWDGRTLMDHEGMRGCICPRTTTCCCPCRFRCPAWWRPGCPGCI